MDLPILLARNHKSHRRTGGNCLSCFKSLGGLYWSSTLSSPCWDLPNHWLLGSSLPPPPQPALDHPGVSRSEGGPIVSSRRCGGFYLVPLSIRCEKGKTSVLASTHHPQWKALHTHVMRQDFPGGASGKEPTCRCRRHKRPRFYPWVGKIPLEESMATHSSILAWRIPWTEEYGGLQSIG